MKAENINSSLNITDDKIREFILDNPEVILESLKRHEDKLRLVTKYSEKTLIENEFYTSTQNISDYIGGNVEGSITLVEFLDYQCGYCKKVHPKIQALLEANPELRFIVKEFPILGNQSLKAAKASISVLIIHGSSMYKEFTSKLLRNNTEISTQSINNLIKSIGGNQRIIQDKMESKEVYTILDSNYRLAEKLNIRGTPTFIIGTEIIRGYKNIEELQEIINLKKQEL